MLTEMLQWGVRQSAEVENLMTSVERVLEYGELPQEEGEEKEDRRLVQGDRWPTDGVVRFDNVFLRYDEKDKLVLNGLSFATKRHEKIGIVGRTGAGKSSLVVALFRLAEPTGSITIDGEEALDLGLHHLRCGVSAIVR